MQIVRALGTIVRTRVYKYVHSMCIVQICKQGLAYIAHTYIQHTIRETSKLGTCVI